MKQLFFSLVALVCATMSYAQSSLIATLSHDGEISTFYGTGALRDAHAAAQHGDIITLSSGAFPSVNITKAITLRGAGMQVDTIAKTQPTIITGNFEINIPDSVEQRLTVEGLYCSEDIMGKNLKNASFLKDVIKKIEPKWEGKMYNITFIHCKISEFINYNNSNNSNSASFVNCYFVTTTTNYNLECTNCFIINRYALSSIYQSTLNNCIIYSIQSNIYNNSYYMLDKSCAANYCLYKGSLNRNFCFNNIVNNSSNSYLSGELNTLFKTYTGNYTDDETFELTDEAKAKYLGSDGTEIGIHGGFLPFDPTPTNPQITKCNVASKSTADGKLSVDIEVSAAE